MNPSSLSRGRAFTTRELLGAARGRWNSELVMIRYPIMKCRSVGMSYQRTVADCTLVDEQPRPSHAGDRHGPALAAQRRLILQELVPAD